MKRLNQCLAATVLAIVAATASAAPRDGLLVRLSAPQPVLRGDVDVVVEVTVTNTTRAAITLLSWELPSGTLDNASFRITRDGEPVRYTGARVKRAAPTADDYVRIEAGETRTYAVELTAAYDLSRSGRYAIEYLSKGARDAAAAPLRSEALYLWLEGRSGRAAVTEAVGAPASVGFSSCSATRQTTLLQANTEATTYADQSVRYFASTRSATRRYTEWFGVVTRERFATARAHFNAIQDAFATKPIVYDCGCTSSAYAYVFPAQPYKIYLCNAFWTAPMTGTDSKAGTLIHEMSHFTVVADTDDWAYGQTAARALAISNPDRALNNADNHEYFAENTPTLP